MPTDGPHAAVSAIKIMLLQKGLTEHSFLQLASRGFLTKEILAVMQKEDIEEAGITLLGQMRLLEHIIGELKPASQAP